MTCVDAQIPLRGYAGRSQLVIDCTPLDNRGVYWQHTLMNSSQQDGLFCSITLRNCGSRPAYVCALPFNGTSPRLSIAAHKSSELVLMLKFSDSFRHLKERICKQIFFCFWMLFQLSCLPYWLHLALERKSLLILVVGRVARQYCHIPHHSTRICPDLGPECRNWILIFP